MGTKRENSKYSYKTLITSQRKMKFIQLTLIRKIYKKFELTMFNSILHILSKIYGVNQH